MTDHRCLIAFLIFFTPLADLGGRAGHTPPPIGPNSCFRMHFHRKVPTSEVHAPLREILDPPLYAIVDVEKCTNLIPVDFWSCGNNSVEYNITRFMQEVCLPTEAKFQLARKYLYSEDFC